MERLPGVANYSVLVKETEQGVAFLHSVVNRPANRSYGIQVARLAGIPMDVINRAAHLLELREDAGRALVESMEGMRTTAVTTNKALSVERENSQKNRSSAPATPPAVFELPLFATQMQQLIERVANTEILKMTPLEAMNVLNDLSQAAREVLSWDKSGS